ncbi:uncharacterized protein LOC113333588 [Papaver somniferum]|uniref:uncharacterized protein LOC113333588 n=1 Tax=Papaver somniferum TaxID=3469 RepID=UPI000E6F757D|nr:uncharacterized protein LOC113333588 [Papaver somniferum]
MKVAQGYYIASMCSVCKQNQDSMPHLLWSCNFSLKIWKWLGNIFNFPIPVSFENIIHCAKNHSPIVREIWTTAAFCIMRELWFLKNRIMFENVQPNENDFISRILYLVHLGGYMMKGNRWSQDYDSQILNFFQLGHMSIKFTAIKECIWLNPPKGFVLFCCDGAAAGNPGLADFGIITRDHVCAVLGTISGGIGVASNYIAESLAIIWALEWSVKMQHDNIIIRSDSKSVVEDF